MNKKFKIVTLGCKVNQYETASLQEKLQSKNWKSTEASSDADLIIVNTCIVTQRASYQSRQAVRKAIRENPAAKIAVVGCYPEVFPEELSKIDGPPGKAQFFNRKKNLRRSQQQATSFCQDAGQKVSGSYKGIFKNSGRL